ncbi:MAG TPA: LytTR family DNA-binding domain-containing protein [Chitinophagaceae bacterium]|jgi:DNA-binding LytR/AlgR family response regulator|nr:LytTR family DNA-binding domain-containing protein [Chitinophagaceae bacterium]
MLNTVIIEDERSARQSLVHSLMNIDTGVNVIAQLSSVKESIEFFSTAPQADLIFCDVQLEDGLSFEIFTKVEIKIPVIFITGYDQFVMNAFEYNGIDYLLKPVSEDELQKAINKYRKLEKHFSNQPLDNLVQYVSTRKKTRLIVKKGLENISLRLEDIVLFFTENKIVYVVDKWGKKYIVDKNLGELEEELDNAIFFRANRQYIVNINYIKGFKSYEKVKLLVDLIIPELNYCIIISQETAPAFRKWMHEA